MPIKSQIKIYNYLREIVSLKMCWEFSFINEIGYTIYFILLEYSLFF